MRKRKGAAHLGHDLGLWLPSPTRPAVSSETKSGCCHEPCPHPQQGGHTGNFTKCANFKCHGFQFTLSMAMKQRARSYLAVTTTTGMFTSARRATYAGETRSMMDQGTSGNGIFHQLKNKLLFRTSDLSNRSKTQELRFLPLGKLTFSQLFLTTWPFFRFWPAGWHQAAVASGKAFSAMGLCTIPITQNRSSACR